MERGIRNQFEPPYRRKKSPKMMLLALVGIVLIVLSVIMVFIFPFQITEGPELYGLPDETVEVTKYWPYVASNSVQFENSPINHSIAYRVTPAAGEIRTDRIYVPAGSRLYGIDPTYGTLDWTSPIDFSDSSFGDPNPIISVDPIVVNWGDAVNINEGYFWIYVGTYSGSVYAINEFVPPQSPPPSSTKIGTIDGYATGLAVYSGDTFGVTYNREVYTPYDTVVVGSSTGFIYFWKVNKTGHHGPYEIQVGDSPIHIVGQPMIGYTLYPYFSPSFYYSPKVKNRPYLYVGCEDGHLFALNITDITNPSIEWQLQVLREPGISKWTTAPTVLYSPVRPVQDTVVFAATDDGYLWAVYASNGTPLPRWGGPLRISHGSLDDGRLSQPLLIRGSTHLYLGSSSGYAYSIEHVSPEQSNGIVKVDWYFRDPRRQKGTTYITARPTLWESTLFIASNYDQRTPEDYSDDNGTLIALSTLDGSRKWYETFDSPIMSSYFAIESMVLPSSAIYFGTEGGSVYAFRTFGMIFPGTMRTCPDGSRIPVDYSCVVQASAVPYIAVLLIVVGVITVVFVVMKSLVKWS